MLTVAVLWAVAWALGARGVEVGQAQDRAGRRGRQAAPGRGQGDGGQAGAGRGGAGGAAAVDDADGGRGDADPLAAGADGLEEAARDADAAARAARATRGPAAPELPVGRGEVLVAPMGVREVAHDVEVTLAHGLALVEHRITLSSSARHAAEARYRLAVPEGARLSALSVCDAAGTCRTGAARGAAAEAAYQDAVRARPAAGDGRTLPVGRARIAADARGAHVDVAVAPVPAGGALGVRVRYVAEAPLRSGRVALTLPERGRDARTTAAQVRVRAPGMLAPTADGLSADEAPLTVDAWMPVTVEAQAASGGAVALEAWRVACGDREACVRVRASAGPRAGEPAELIVLVDASPSTEGAARARIGAAVASLLAAAPRGTRARAVAFAARAEALVGEPTEAALVPLVPVAQGASLALGASTRVEAAIAAIEPWLGERGARRPSVVLIGDGGLTASDAAEEALGRLAARATVFVVEVSGRGPHRLLAAAAAASGGAVIDAAREADAAVRGAGDLGLAGRVGVVFAPVVAPEVVVRAGAATWRLGPLRAGEEAAVERVVPAGAAVRVAAGPLATSARAAPPEYALGLAEVSARETAERAPAASTLAAVALGPEAAAGTRAREARGEAVREARVRGARGEARAAATGGCAPHGPPRHPSGVSTDAAPVALATPRACALGPDAPVFALPPELAEARAAPTDDREPGALRGRARRALDGRGVPAETVLGMLRARLVPAARACLRDDRAGRADHAVRAVLAFALEDREIVRADVEGALSDALRACLRDALDRLDVPRFSGVVAVRYPIYTEGVAPPPTVELGEATAGEFDRVLGRGVSVDDVRRLRR